MDESLFITLGRKTKCEIEHLSRMNSVFYTQVIL